jgi:hypothetical protein
LHLNDTQLVFNPKAPSISPFENSGPSEEDCERGGSPALPDASASVDEIGAICGRANLERKRRRQDNDNSVKMIE